MNEAKKQKRDERARLFDLFERDITIAISVEQREGCIGVFYRRKEASDVLEYHVVPVWFTEGVEDTTGKLNSCCHGKDTYVV